MYDEKDFNLCNILIIINGTTARLGPWPPLRAFVMVMYVRCEVISPTINLILVILIRPPETSVSKASRPSGEAGETRVRNGR
jgi:hypothetical protein